MRELLRHSVFKRMFLGQTISMLGDWLLLLVLAMWVKDLTGSSGLAGGVMFIMAVPSLAAPFTGVLVDRVPRRRALLMAVDVLSCLLVSTIWFVGNSPRVEFIYAIAALHGLLRGIHSAALTALMQTALPTSHLGRANASMQTARQGLRLVGPLLGAGLYTAAGPGWVALADAATFAISAGTLATLVTTETTRTAAPESPLRALNAGIRHLVHVPDLKAMCVTAVVAGGSLGAMEVLVFEIVGQGLHRPAAFISVLMTCQGVGALVSGVLTMRLIQTLHDTGLVVLAFALATTSVALLAIPTVVAAVMGSLLLGAALPMLSVGSVTALQRQTDPQLMGRVAASFDMVLTVPHVLSIAGGAIIVNSLDYRLCLAGVALGCAASCSYGWVRLVSRPANARRPSTIPSLTRDPA